MFENKPLGNIKLLLFDMDGLLLDTERLYTIAQVELLKPFGVEFTPEVKAKMMGRKDADATEVMVAHYGLEGKLDPVEFIQKRNEILEELFPTCDLMPGVEKLLTHMINHGIPMALATSSHAHHFQLKTRKHLELFKKAFGDHIITGDQVSIAKPEPEIFQLAASKFPPIPTDQILVFEDAPLGVEAALRAKMKCVWISTAAQEDNPVPHQHLASMEEFRPELWGLPAFP